MFANGTSPVTIGVQPLLAPAAVKPDPLKRNTTENQETR